MKRSTLCGTAASLLCVGLFTAGAAVAQEARNQQQTEQQQQAQAEHSKRAVMKECVARERAGDSTMTESEAKKACHDALRAERDNQDNEPQPPHQQQQ
jgi:Na+-translocating ferredoxin:NAD+ oxidoreductase RnfG subunit